MKWKFFLPVLFLACTFQAMAITPVEEGKGIFTARCMTCHNVNKVFVGPALAGVAERRSMDWIIKFVHSSQTLIKSGDKDASTLFAKFNNIPMPDQHDLTEENIKSIVAYIKSETGAAVIETPFAKPTKTHPAYLPVSSSNYGFFISYLFAIGLLVYTLLFFVKVQKYARTKVWE